MTTQPNKPGGLFSSDGKPRPVEDEQAVKNQSVVSPEDYPDKASGDDAIGGDGVPGKK